MSAREKTALPLIRLKGSRAAPLSAGTDAVTFGLSSVLSAGSKAADLSPLLAEELLRHLHRKLHDVSLARVRAGWFGGRFYNWVLCIDLQYISLSGRHLSQAVALLDLAPPNGLGAGSQYLLRADIARLAHDALGAQLGVMQDVLAQGLS